jgi:hypothetical protein
MHMSTVNNIEILSMLSAALCDVLLKAANDWFVLFCRFMEFDVICCISLTSLKETGAE